MWSAEVNNLSCKVLELLGYDHIKEEYEKRKKEQELEFQRRVAEINTDLQRLLKLFSKDEEDIDNQYNVFIYDTIRYPPGTIPPEFDN